MKVSSIQMDMAFSSPDENYRKAEELIRKAVKDNAPDTVVLPETWNLGFFPRENLYALADKEGERTKSLLSSLAKELSVNIVGGSVVRSDGEDVRILVMSIPVPENLWPPMIRHTSFLRWMKTNTSKRGIIFPFFHWME